MNEEEKLKKYVSIVPNSRQLIVQEMKFYAFVHYTVNTFTGREWGTGKESPSVFNPKCQNTDKWCEAIKSAGMKGVILTCKHHDGFCLWQTKTTKHSIASSPYKNGLGDVVKEVSDSCKKYGLKFGVYLSPWDRNSEYYSTEKYNDFYIEQLTELLTNYGDIFMLWLDGACASHRDGKPAQKYDFERIWSTAVKLQPNICMSGCAPDVRWVGNESGKCRESEWNVVPKFEYELQNLAVNCQAQEDFVKFQKRCVDVMVQDLGSRKVLENYDELMWYPAEVDVSMRKGWYYHKIENYLTVKSLNTLMKIYYNSVGANSLFLLNIPPTKEGLFYKKDVKRLRQIGYWLNKEKQLMLKQINVQPLTLADKNYQFDITFDTTKIDRIRLEEDTTFSQRVESFSVYSVENGKEILLYRGTVIGFGRIAIFKPTVANHLRVVINQSRLQPHIKICEVYAVGAYRVK
ncbi:MAG: alpha-L-fucosidase [Clostridia bacterium]